MIRETCKVEWSAISMLIEQDHTAKLYGRSKKVMLSLTDFVGTHKIDPLLYATMYLENSRL